MAVWDSRITRPVFPFIGLQPPLYVMGYGPDRLDSPDSSQEYLGRIMKIT